MAAYFPVIGLEVHAQLTTRTKMFCSCPVNTESHANTNVCPVCLGMPGAMPVPNQRAVELAIRLGLALNCEIDQNAMWTRKNYFYPDLPKGYQITQTGGLPVYDHPVCKGGWLDIELADGSTKRIGITRIHMEEDAGKLIHDMSPDGSHFDANRCGTPLCEIVSEPDLRTAEEAVAYLQKLKQILEYTGVCNANMESGNMRCDANVSIRPSETSEFGTRAEVKNLNSFSNLQKAIEAEILLQTITLDSGKKVDQCTKRFDPSTCKTSVIRSKEDAHDYRYFPEPDMVRLRIPTEQIESIRSTMPELPDARRHRFITSYTITSYDAQVLTIDKLVSDWYDLAAAQCKSPKALANWVSTELLRDVKDLPGGMSDCRIQPLQLARMVNLIEDNTISGKIGKVVFREMFETGMDPEVIIQAKGLLQISDTGAIEAVVREIVAANPAQFADYKSGKVAIKGFLIGQIMKKSGGKANPGMVNELLEKLAAE